MVQIVPQTDIGQLLGQGVGKGFSSGIEMLLKSKLEGMQQQQLQKQKSELQFQQLQSILGGNPELEPPGSIEPSHPQEDAELEVAAQQSPALQPADDESISRKYSPEQIAAATLVNPTLGKVLQDQSEAQAKIQESKSKREFERAKPVLLRADEQAEELAQREMSLNQMENAINEGNLGFFSRDNLADVTGLEGFRTAKGAAFITAGKEFFLGSLKRAGARPNQWIEQQIQKMLPKLGRSKLANLTVVEALRSEVALQNAYQDILADLEQEDKNKYGEVRGNIGRRANKLLKNFATEEQSRLEVRLRDLAKTSKNIVKMLDREGRMREVPRDQVREAKKAGYKLS